jgi:hypothetical protein
MVYRIEHPTEPIGLWYNRDAVLAPTIHDLCPNAVAGQFPMPHNDLHRKDGKVWVSAGKDRGGMNYWFSAEDAVALHKAGFRVYEFEVTDWQELEHEVLFCRDDVVAQTEIPLADLWDIKQGEAAA